MSRSLHTLNTFSLTLLGTLALSSPSLRADVPEPSLPPSCETSDASCLIIEEHQSSELSGVGAIDFVAVLEDSRCPLDVMCVWAGRVQVEMKHAYGTSAEKFVLVLGQGLQNAWVDGRTGIALVLEQVWPEPNLSHPIEKPYRIKLRIIESPDELPTHDDPTPGDNPVQQQPLDGSERPYPKLQSPRVE